MARGRWGECLRSARCKCLHAYPPGSVIVLPGNTFHFHWAKSREYVSQVTGIGPLGLEYLNPEDDLRSNSISATVQGTAEQSVVP
jgi:hypothetical protein